MNLTRTTKLVAASALVLAAAGVAVALAASPATDLENVPSANTKSQGYAPASKLSAGLAQIPVAQGSTKVENPSAAVSYYGYDNDTLNAAGEPIMVASAATGNTEAHKTEPDKNVYLVFDKGLNGADPNYDYGTSFVFQGHEAGTPGYLTRINLDADAAHRVTLLATQDASSNPISTVDGITWDPFAQRDTKWITIHDTAVDGNAPFNANLAAKAADGTPFKRPENGVFRPDGKFNEFYFDETGDTNATSPENACCGGWESIFKLTQADPSANTGKLTLFFKGDQAHAGFDNVAFLTKDVITVVEDTGDNLHTQRNALDSGFLLDVTKDYSNPANTPVRWLAEGRDASATLDADNAGFGKNDQDNEITGIHVSDGDPTANGLLGRKEPHPFEPNSTWRVFYTQQHGDNTTWEVVRP